MTRRFKDDHADIDSFSDSFLVCCPKCNRMATVARSPDQTALRISCSECGFLKDQEDSHPGVRMTTTDASFCEEGMTTVGLACDWNFHTPLWLTIDCCGHELWAYNGEHLAWLKAYVSATLRESTHNSELGWKNRSLASRLPKWVKSAKNRKEILKAIGKLEQKLPGV